MKSNGPLFLWLPLLLKRLSQLSQSRLSFSPSLGSVGADEATDAAARMLMRMDVVFILSEIVEVEDGLVWYDLLCEKVCIIEGREEVLSA